MNEKDKEQTERLQMRVSKSFLKAVDDWRRAQPEILPRAEAIRVLVLRGISAKGQK